MIRHNARNVFLGAATAVGLVAAAVMLTGHLTAEAQGQPGQLGQTRGEQAPGEQAALQVGTYDAEAAFQAHPAQNDMQGALQQAQTQMQQAQQQGNQEMMQQIQGQFEEARNQAIQQFEQDVSRVLPNVAEDAGVQVVAVEVAYADDDVKTVDITRGLTEALGNLGNAQQRNMPPGGTQQGRPQTPPGGAPGGTQPQR